MTLFAKGITRVVALSAVLAIFVLIPPEVLERGPDFCLWKHLFGLSACPACGSTRALVWFFHGHFGQALAYNRNVVVTGPLLLVLLAQDAIRMARQFLTHAGPGHRP